MKKLVGAITGCIAAYYVMDTLIAASMACAWGDLVKYGPCRRRMNWMIRFTKSIASATERYLILQRKYF